ncbi:MULTISPECIES: DksA/TraR family C4-type zinc finger protein [Providencia]|uniref:DksA/TraR family C4-type zinc finger protein n=1 Tax=Providencia TaxID=586 RepID=UPI000EDB2C4C|nr:MULTISPECIES: DksA/TraR family C4-type zinc finger protein [Providencia]HCI95665.1 DksA/TraR family C4-type zinc finger protein [Providencia sp.]EJD6082399.1 DksA/TraR family C4-type zinc finger protein [Providencia rettgeri]EJD6400313.1 DksA/TraR family C4-type zinc finger protein [Providencia rettgeri]EJD6582465.1 DksA/TraR family C4-type zinc finger protein [Providencia rettgeri]EJD6599439.1 DksA/TraR family C4-type zinc finger protein [Providencia rettgeri]
MANGWANENAVQEQIDATLDDAITKARNQLHSGESAEICEECGETIPEARRLALPGVRLCISCQNELDKKNAAYSGYNRRGSKDSQLR